MTETPPTSVRTTKIEVEAAGPLVASNDIALVDHLGVPIETDGPHRLCRCGASSTKPFCDYSHLTNGFDDAKSPDHIEDRVDTYVGVAVSIRDNRGICAHSGLCTDRVARAFHADSEPFVTPNGARADDLIAAARRCPSGALSVEFDGVEAHEVADTQRPPEIVVSKNGPYWVRGGVEVVDGDGSPVPRNEGASLEHCALCRCGNSDNKPFCSGAHWRTNFSDPQDPEKPTIFEWAGGYPALVDMLTLFYGKYIPEDDLLRPVFLQMSSDHPERVAAWLGEVFGGPSRYSDEMGGYQAMVSHHLGRALDEEKRQRWVALLLRSMDEVGISNNAEFRAAVSAYLEWGTRLAVENSQPGATPPPNMPMPLWTWTTSAGPPWFRTSALDDPEARHEVNLPAEGETPIFADHISTLFRERDVHSMSWAFDLSSHDDVAAHAEKIAARTSDETMPPDAPWPTEWVEAFRAWIDAGTP